VDKRDQYRRKIIRKKNTYAQNVSAMGKKLTETLLPNCLTDFFSYM